MPESTRHLQGTPLRAGLSTTGGQGALAFYGALFGWAGGDREMDPGMHYHMQKPNGLEVAAMYQPGGEEKAQGVSPHWKTYFTVNDIEKSAMSATESGAAALFGPIDVFEVRHAAILKDPQGAMFFIFRPAN